MKITERKLARIIKEERALFLRDRLLKEEPTRNIETVGDLKALIKTAVSKKKADQGKSAFKDLTTGLLADAIPGGGTIKGMFDAVKSMYSLPDEKRTGTALDYMDVDDDVSAIVDDPIENSFIKTVSEKIEGMADDKPLKDVNMTKLLAQFISKKFNNRTVVGFGESRLRKNPRNVKITENQLRKIIRESIMSEMDSTAQQDLSRPIPIDDLQFVDEEGYGAMMFPGAGYSYSVREQNFEAEKAKLKKRYGDDVMISTPDPRYPKVKKLHSQKFAKAASSERQNFMRHQDMMRKRLGRNPGLGT